MHGTNKQHQRKNNEFAFFTTDRKINNTEKQLCNFSFHDFEAKENNINQLMKKTFLYYQKYDFLRAYKLNEKIIKLCLKQKNYIYLFLY